MSSLDSSAQIELEALLRLEPAAALAALDDATLDRIAQIWPAPPGLDAGVAQLREALFEHVGPDAFLARAAESDSRAALTALLLESEHTLFALTELSWLMEQLPPPAPDSFTAQVWSATGSSASNLRRACAELAQLTSARQSTEAAELALELLERVLLALTRAQELGVPLSELASALGALRMRLADSARSSG